MIKLLAAHVVPDPAKRRLSPADEEVIREVPLRPDGSFVHELQLLHGEQLRIYYEEDGRRAWEWIRLNPEHGPVESVMPVNDDGSPA